MNVAHAEQKSVDDNVDVQAEIEKLSFKLTSSAYLSSDQNHAGDVNVRASWGNQLVWLGYYRNKVQYQQTRAGYEYHWDAGSVSTVFSAQLASGGFAGGSITSQIGDDYYAIVGFGRTNLHAYYNLNFDPNDAITLGAGTRVFKNNEFSVYQIRDDRLGTQQRVTHGYWHYKLAARQALSVDVTYKRGLSDDNNFVKGYGLSVTYAHAPYFVRLARDQYANFSQQHQTRISVGTNF